MNVRQYFFEKQLEWGFLEKFDHFAYQKLYQINKKNQQCLIFFLAILEICAKVIKQEG